MSAPEPPSFHLRLPAKLKAQLNAARGPNSLNSEIVDRLERSFDPEPALHIAEILRPFLATLDDQDRAKVLELAIAVADILVKSPRKKRR